MDFLLQPGGNMRGVLRVPGDKSISHRAIMLGAIADGVTEVKGFLQGEDALATLNALRSLGVRIDGPGTAGLKADEVRVHGAGREGLRAPDAPIDLGNSGTSMRLLAGLLAGQPFKTVLTGDRSLSVRPMERIAEPLRQMGAVIETTGEGGTPPLTIHGTAALRGITYSMPMASAQVKSCLLLAGLFAEGETRITEPAPTRDHTERMLTGFGYAVERDGPTCAVRGGGRLRGCRIDVPADISSAAFFMVAACLIPGADITLPHVGINPTRTGIIDILRLMGADVTLSGERDVGGEPVADIRVRYAPLQGIDIPAELVPLAIDEFPALFVAAACAEGRTRLTGAGELRIKESDRIQVMADGLAMLGVRTLASPDGLSIDGIGEHGQLGGGTLDSHHDHRIAMAFAMAALRARAPIRIRGSEIVATSFPNFVELATGAGLQLTTDP